MISGSGFLVKVVQAVQCGAVSCLRKDCLVLWGGYGGAMTWAGVSGSAIKALWMGTAVVPQPAVSWPWLSTRARRKGAGL